jgi:peptide deformylase
VILPIRVLGDPVLRRRAEAVGGVDDALRRLVDDLFETMYLAKGIGLAAPQVGVSQRLFVVDVDGAKHVFVNPELVSVSPETAAGEEGCLSIPEVFAEVTRPSVVTMRGTTLDGDPFELTADELLGRCLQHEFDHLEGKLFPDHLSFLKRRRAMTEWGRMEKEFPGHVRILGPGDPGDPDAPRGDAASRDTTHPDSERM